MGEKPQGLVVRLDDTLGVMSAMLDTLLDIDEIEAGTVRPEPSALTLDSLTACATGSPTAQRQSASACASRLDCHRAYSLMAIISGSLPGSGVAWRATSASSARRCLWSSSPSG